MDTSGLTLTPTGEGVQLKIRVSPGQRRDAVVGPHGDALRLMVRAAPERGKANQAVVALLAEACGVARSAVRLVAGESSRDKRVVVVGIDVATLRARLAALLAAEGRQGT